MQKGNAVSDDNSNKKNMIVTIFWWKIVQIDNKKNTNIPLLSLVEFSPCSSCRTAQPCWVVWIPQYLSLRYLRENLAVNLRCRRGLCEQRCGEDYKRKKLRKRTKVGMRERVSHRVMMTTVIIRMIMTSVALTGHDKDNNDNYNTTTTTTIITTTTTTPTTTTTCYNTTYVSWLPFATVSISAPKFTNSCKSSSLLFIVASTSPLLIHLKNSDSFVVIVVAAVVGGREEVVVV